MFSWPSRRNVAFAFKFGDKLLIEICQIDANDEMKQDMYLRFCQNRVIVISKNRTH